MKTFIYKNREYKFKTMEEANKELPLGDGAWFGPEDGEPETLTNGRKEICLINES